MDEPLSIASVHRCEQCDGPVVYFAFDRRHPRPHWKVGEQMVCSARCAIQAMRRLDG